MSETHVCHCAQTGANPYLPMDMLIQRVVDETDDRTIKSFDLAFVNAAQADAFCHRPGQFCELSIFGQGEAPFGIASSPQEADWLRFTVKRAGRFTDVLHTTKAGDTIGLRGPLGNSFPLDEMRGKHVVVIGGGFAFTTLRALIVTLLADDVRGDYGDLTVIYGTRTPGLQLYKGDLAAWQTRDDISVHRTIDVEASGWPHRVGFVPTVLGEVAPSSDNALAIVCGPPVMIRFTLPVLEELGFGKERIYTSLENRMQCGIGKCGRCNIGHKYVCIDGPVFSLAELCELPDEY